MFDVGPIRAADHARRSNACRQALPESLHQGEREQLHAGPRNRSRFPFMVNRPKHEPGFRLDRQEVGRPRRSGTPFTPTQRTSPRAALSDVQRRA